MKIFYKVKWKEVASCDPHPRAKKKSLDKTSRLAVRHCFSDILSRYFKSLFFLHRDIRIQHIQTKHRMFKKVSCAERITKKKITTKQKGLKTKTNILLHFLDLDVCVCEKEREISCVCCIFLCTCFYFDCEAFFVCKFWDQWENARNRFSPEERVEPLIIFLLSILKGHKLLILSWCARNLNLENCESWRRRDKELRGSEKLH